MPSSYYFKNQPRRVRGGPPIRSRDIRLDSDSSAASDCESSTEDGFYRRRCPLQDGCWAEYHEEAATQELVFLCRMECISKMKEKIENNDKLLLADVEAFRNDLKDIQRLWNQVTLQDLEFAARSSGKHLLKLFDMLTVRVPQVSIKIDDPVGGGDKKVYRLVRQLPADSLFYSAIRGKKKFFPGDTDTDAQDIESLWTQQVSRSLRERRFSSDDWRVQVQVDAVGVGLMQEKQEQCDYADILIIMVLANFSGYATSAHAMLFMCWEKQMPYYWANIFAACASIISLIDITYCTKVLGCSDGHNLGPFVVLSVGLWFLVTDVIYGFILLRETNYAKNVLWSSKVFEFALEATTTIFAVNMACHGWTFAREHYVQYFLLVASRWLHLLYILIPVPVVGRTVLPMYQAVFSYESKAFIVVNLVILLGSFQAYISLRSDINADSVNDGLLQPIGDALLAQYRLNFLGDFSVDELRGESLEVEMKDDRIGKISVKNGDPHRRQGVAFFVIFVTFIQAVLMLNLYIGILGESYAHHKEKIDNEFMQFRANFMLKNMCLVRFFNALGLKRLNTYLACYERYAAADLVWAITPLDKADACAAVEGLCPDLKDAIGQKPLSELEALMEELGRKRKAD